MPSPPVPLVSVITPARNAARFLPETMRSVRAQTHESWEHLVIDDASGDETRALVVAAAAEDPRVRLIPLDRNVGQAEARNTGLRQARGRYVAFLDSDDLWVPDKLRRQLAHMEERRSVFSYTGYSLIDDAGRPLNKRVRVPAEIDYEGLLKNTIIGCLTVMIDVSGTGPISMLPLRQHEDLALWLRLLRSGIKATGLQEDLARYRIVQASASRNKLRSALHMWKVYRQVEELPLARASWCYAHYAWNAYWKNRV